MGHIISGEGVNPDPEKLKAMEDWSKPKNVKQLRGFLGLKGYYRRFIKQYARIATPMTELLKKDAFHWNEEADNSFSELKKAMPRALALAYLDFAKEFVVETDACNVRIGGNSLLGKAFNILLITPSSWWGGWRRHQHMWEKCLPFPRLWGNAGRHYLLGKHFTLRTNHKKLKKKISLLGDLESRTTKLFVQIPKLQLHHWV